MNSPRSSVPAPPSLDWFLYIFESSRIRSGFARSDRKIPFAKRAPRFVQQTVGLTRSRPFERFQQAIGSDQGPNQQMNMICHNDPGSQFIMSQARPFVDGIDHDLRYLRLLKIHRSIPRRIKLPV